MKLLNVQLCVYLTNNYIPDLFSQNPSRKRKTDGDGDVRGFKKMRLDKKLKKKYQNNQKTGQNRDNKGKRSFQSRDGGKSFKNDKRKKFHDQDGKFSNQRSNNNNQSGKSKKVFGGKFNKMNKAGKGRPAKGGKGKGKSRK